MAGMLCFFLIGFSREVRAEEVIRTDENQITVTWDAFVEAPQEEFLQGETPKKTSSENGTPEGESSQEGILHGEVSQQEIPPEHVLPETELAGENNVAGRYAQLAETYEFEGETYYLKSYQLISAKTREKVQMAEDTVTYEAVEQADTLPRQIKLEVTDEDSGLVVTAEVPAVNTKYDNWRWVSGFEFPVIVQQYDAGQFYLGDRIVTEEANDPFAEYKTELLELAGLNPDYYSIETTQWVSQPWTGEDGLVYRQARASGRKYVADCEVTYAGNVTFPEVPASAWEAVYSRKDKENEVRIRPIQRQEGEESKVDETEEEQDIPAPGWTEYFRQVMRAVISLLLPLILVAILVSVCVKKKAQKKKK
jgi:hypothetical protein